MEIDDKTLIEELKEKQESCSMNQLQELWAQSAQNKPINLKPIQVEKADRKEGQIKKKRRPKGISKIKSEGNDDQNFENPYNSKSLSPWAVENVSVFLRYCCPECDFNHLDLQHFSNHALENHAESILLFSNLQTAVDPLLSNIKIEEKEFCEFCQNNAFECICYIDIPTNPYPDSEVENSFSVKRKQKKDGSLKKKTKKLKTNEKQVTCEICSILELVSIEEVVSHRREKHMQEKQLLCPHCDHRPVRWENLCLHIDMKHPEHGESNFSCADCKKTFIFQNTYKRHYCSAKQNQKKRVCELCGFECVQKVVFDDHMLLKHNSEDIIKLFCEKCGFSASTKRQLQNHMNFKHKKENHKKCPFCEFRSPRTQKLHIHIDMNHPETAVKNFLCEKCNMAFIYKETFSDHKYNCIHGEYYKTNRTKNAKKSYAKRIPRYTFKCDYCDELIETSTSTKLKSHYSLNHPGKPIIAKGHTKYQCTNCDDLFLFEAELKCHLDLEHGVKTDKKHCPKCRKSYDDKHTACYFDNNKSEDGSENGKRFSCAHCEKTYTTEGHLKSHIRADHEKRLDFECPNCDKKFGSRIKLQNHVYYSHSHVTCDICNKEIAKPDFKRHRVFVHKETRGVWLCERCPKSVFFSKATFAKHIREKH